MRSRAAIAKLEEQIAGDVAAVGARFEQDAAARTRDHQPQARAGRSAVRRARVDAWGPRAATRERCPRNEGRSRPDRFCSAGSSWLLLFGLGLPAGLPMDRARSAGQARNHRRRSASCRRRPARWPCRCGMDRSGLRSSATPAAAIAGSRKSRIRWSPGARSFPSGSCSCWATTSTARTRRTTTRLKFERPYQRAAGCRRRRSMPRSATTTIRRRFTTRSSTWAGSAITRSASRRSGWPAWPVLACASSFSTADRSIRRQLEWLREELAASGTAWKICYFHHPLYTSGRYRAERARAATRARADPRAR